MRGQRNAILSLHIIVFLWGFTAILGDLLSLSAYWIVWWRVGITCISLLCIPAVISGMRKVSKRLIFILAGVGVIIALHWITFFGAIKYANASIALIALSTTALITSVLEPVIMRTKIDPIDIACGVAVVPGMLFVIGGLDYSGLIGLIVGLSSAFFSAVFAIINKKYVTQVDTRVITFIELGSAFLFMTLFIPLVIYYQPNAVWWPTGWDWSYLLILALVCTTLAFIWHLEVLKYISAFTSNLIINLEPVYGIALAALILNDLEELSGTFYIGVLIIMLIVIAYPYIKKRVTKAQEKKRQGSDE